jgi:hypothetical protein
MSIQEVATGIVALVRAGKFDEATKTYYSPDIVSVEAFAAPGESREAVGMAALQAKGEWWEQNMEVHGIETTDPMYNGEQFALYMTFDVTNKASGQRYPIKEVAVYTVKDGKIVHESFFYGPMEG